MKRLNCILTALLTAVLSLLTASAGAQSTVRETPGAAPDAHPAPLFADSVEVSLLTCAPGGEAYSLYGHTALRYNDLRRGMDVVANWGVFSFDQPMFVPRFVLGLTDYEMGLMRFSDFCEEFRCEGRSVVAQVLNLTPQEKAAIAAAIGENWRPENRVYRYNYFYDNCTLRARNIIMCNVAGRVEFPAHTPAQTWRDAERQCARSHPWAMFGNDLLLGAPADREMSVAERQFIPDNLRQDFAKAVVVAPDGARRPLVLREETVLAVPALVPAQPFAAPAWVLAALAVLVFVAMCVERRRHRAFWMLDAVLFLLTGLCGLLLFVMVFSQHPTVSINALILFLNPLNLVFLWPVVRRLRAGRTHWWLLAWAILSLLCCAIGLFWQSYPYGMGMLAMACALRAAAVFELKVKS